MNNTAQYKTYYSTACCVCLNVNNIKRCSSCKIMPYCSKEHQETDWKKHKALCKAIRESLGVIKLQIGCSFNEWREFRYSLKLAWESSLKRKLQLHENFIWMFLRSCHICHALHNLEECTNCFMISYCSEHKNSDVNHAKYCDSLKLCHAIDCYLLQAKLLPNICLKEIDVNLKRDLKQYITDLRDGEGVLNTLKYWSVDLVGTILYGLEVSNLDCKNTELTIQIIGASYMETQKDWGNITEIIFHYLPNLQQINYHFIGPEVVESPIEPHDYFKTFCPSCTKRRFTVFYHKNYYHEICEALPKPDAIYAFNCGLSEFLNDEINDTWKPSLKCIINSNPPQTPVVLTSYTLQESKNDLLRMETFNNVKFLLKHTVNHYCSTRPYRDWSTEKIPVYYCDNYISILWKL